MTSFEPVIGLEVHAQLKTATKIFCGCPTRFGAPPNSQTCPVCLGLPGALPVLNRKVVDYTLRMALAAGCRIEPVSRFDRKNYFYPDLPKGYQISQYAQPIASGGQIEITLDGQKRSIGLTRIHIEEDAGKLIHETQEVVGQPVSLVDLNRAGTPLIEIVSRPELHSPAEAGAYLRRLRSLIRWIAIGDGNMEEGSFRCDANISLRPVGDQALGARTEIKNLNSFKHVEKALQHEITRQSAILQAGGAVAQETRLWDPQQGITQPMRDKEAALDYRYFPDPDLPPLLIDAAWIERVRAALPELPDPRRDRFMSRYGLSAYDAGVLTAERELADYFEACVAAFSQPKVVANWVTVILLGLLNTLHKTIQQCPVAAADLAALLLMVDQGEINTTSAKTVLEQMAATGRPARQLVTELGLTQLSDRAALERIIEQILQAHPRELERYRAGQTRLQGFFVGRVMQATAGRANPQIVNQLLRQLLTAGPVRPAPHA